jgi:hypothetical protein
MLLEALFLFPFVFHIAYFLSFHAIKIKATLSYFCLHWWKCMQCGLVFIIVFSHTKKVWCIRERSPHYILIS